MANAARPMDGHHIGHCVCVSASRNSRARAWTDTTAGNGGPQRGRIRELRFRRDSKKSEKEKWEIDLCIIKWQNDRSGKKGKGMSGRWTVKERAQEVRVFRMTRLSPCCPYCEFSIDQLPTVDHIPSDRTLNCFLFKSQVYRPIQPSQVPQSNPKMRNVQGKEGYSKKKKNQVSIYARSSRHERRGGKEKRRS